MPTRDLRHLVVVRLRHTAGRAWSAAVIHPWVALVVATAVIGFAVVNLMIGMPVLVIAALPACAGFVAQRLHRTWAARRRRRSEPTRAGLGAAALLCGLGGVLVTAAAIQAVPYGRDRSNPAVLGEPRWANAETRDLMVRACFACHSNEVDHPPYAAIAPISWAVQRHIDEGRGAVNYSEFAVDPGDAEETVEVILDGSMPPAYFTRFGRNPEAVLSDEDLAALVEGLRATPGMTRSEP